MNAHTEEKEIKNFDEILAENKTILNNEGKE